MRTGTEPSCGLEAVASAVAVAVNPVKSHDAIWAKDLCVETSANNDIEANKRSLEARRREGSVFIDCGIRRIQAPAGSVTTIFYMSAHPTYSTSTF